VYGKIFNSMYDGTLVANWEALITFQQMIVLADDVGVIDMTPHALSNRTGIPIEIIEKGLELLESDDPHSRSPAQNGRRIERLDNHRPWGWKIVNYMHYRQLASHEEKKNADAQRLRNKREASKNGDVAKCRKVSQPVADVAHTDTDTDTDTITTHTSPNGAVEATKVAPKCPHKEILALYHKHCPDLPKVRSWEGTRRQNLSQRFRTHPSLEWWTWFFQVIHRLDFYNGRTDSPRNWKANLDWIVKSANFQKLKDITYELAENQQPETVSERMGIQTERNKRRVIP